MLNFQALECEDAPRDAPLDSSVTDWSYLDFMMSKELFISRILLFDSPTIILFNPYSILGSECFILCNPEGWVYYTGPGWLTTADNITKLT